MAKNTLEKRVHLSLTDFHVKIHYFPKNLSNRFLLLSQPPFLQNKPLTQRLLDTFQKTLFCLNKQSHLLIFHRETKFSKFSTLSKTTPPFSAKNFYYVNFSWVFIPRKVTWHQFNPWKPWFIILKTKFIIFVKLFVKYS